MTFEFKDNDGNVAVLQGEVKTLRLQLIKN